MKNPLELLVETGACAGYMARFRHLAIGNGFDFQAFTNRQTHVMHLFRAHRWWTISRAGASGWDLLGRIVSRVAWTMKHYHKTVEELEMLEHAGHDWDDGRGASEITGHRVFFGSASNNFGVQLPPRWIFASTLQDRRGGLESRLQVGSGKKKRGGKPLEKAELPNYIAP
jgi:peptide subunit release factor RF-3